MKQIDFAKVKVESIDGQTIDVDVRKNLGNIMYMNGQNIEECELGKKIYFSDGEIEIDDNEQKIVIKYIGGYPYVTRHAIEDILK